MQEEMDEFLKFATETLGLTEEQYSAILGERRGRGGQSRRLALLSALLIIVRTPQLSYRRQRSRRRPISSRQRKRRLRNPPPNLSLVHRFEIQISPTLTLSWNKWTRSSPRLVRQLLLLAPPRLSEQRRRSRSRQPRQNRNRKDRSSILAGNRQELSSHRLTNLTTTLGRWTRSWRIYSSRRAEKRAERWIIISSRTSSRVFRVRVGSVDRQVISRVDWGSSCLRNRLRNDTSLVAYFAFRSNLLYSTSKLFSSMYDAWQSLRIHFRKQQQRKCNSAFLFTPFRHRSPSQFDEESAHDRTLRRTRSELSSNRNERWSF